MSVPDSSAVKAELERILSSKLFKTTVVLSNFLRYVVTETIEGKIQEIKEYSIAVKALGKPKDFNPQIDAAIRIHAGRLRRYLMEYYNEEGNNDFLIISLKKGSYIPEFTVRGKTNEFSQPANIPLVQNAAFTNRVAVLPFKNLSGLAENDFMVDGFCEQLSSDLAQFPEIAVISYYSTAKFKGERLDIRSVGKELNISHLITGSIYRDKTHLKISMQLVNAVSGAQLWTQTFERKINSSYPYELLEDVLNQVVPRLAGYYGLISRSVAYSSQLDPALNQDIVDAVFWYYHYEIKFTEDIFRIAVDKTEKALQENPNYALGWAILAQLYIGSLALGYRIPLGNLNEADRCVQKALQLDPDCQHAYISLGYLLTYRREKVKAMAAIERGIAINPRSPYFLGCACFLIGILGEYDKSLEYFKQANTLNPYYPWWVNLGPICAHFYTGNYDEALAYAERINIPGVFWNHVFKIATLAQLSRAEEAAALASQFENQFPGKAAVACSTLKAILFHEIVYDRIKEGLKKAGIPV